MKKLTILIRKQSETQSRKRFYFVFFFSLVIEIVQTVDQNIVNKYLAILNIHMQEKQQQYSNDKR